ncbi:MAG: cation-transporting P-type ATPase [Actinomycetota bacterium]
MNQVSTLTPAKVYQELKTSKRGLTEAEAKKRLDEYGENKIPEIRKRPLIFKFLANFYHTFALLLWFSAALAFVAGMAELAWAIIAVIVINAVFSFWQEYKAEKATEALKKLVPLYAKVIREGERKQILGTLLVPGDVILLEEGDNISADARLAEEFELRTNNATLTGESEPSRRTAEPVMRKGLTLTELPNLVFSSTSVATGSGKAVVFATGMNTQFGRVAYLTQTVPEELSPLQKEVKRVALVVAALAVVLGLVFFLVGSAIARLSLVASSLFAIGMIVANVPEGLLPTLSLSLAVAVQKMVRENALVKKLSSVETLGSTTVICTDKTGTLTQNEMTVREIWANQERIDVSGVGYKPEGEFLENGKPLSQEALSEKLGLLLKVASYCNNARLIPPNGEKVTWSILGDPTEAALLVATKKGGFDYDKALEKESRIYELPFESIRKRMTTIHQVRNPISLPVLEMGKATGVQDKTTRAYQVAYVKGAPKEVLDLCDRIYVNGRVEKITPDQRDEIIIQNDNLAKQALRVLAFAFRELPPNSKKYTVEEVEKDLVFAGLMAMMDPPRPEVEEAVKRCQRAHIRIIMITGDYGLTAESIATRIGMVSGQKTRIVSGAELDGMPDAELSKVLEQKEVIFARVTPDHKLRIATLLRDKGEIVAMTGDGVNDAPALKKADIGVAMGITGTDVAKEASDMILLDDNFATIVNAIAEGRVVYDNIKKFIVYIFAHLTPEVVPFIFFALLKTPLPITPLQILAIDLGTETLPALALGVEPAEPGIMERPPRSKKEGLLNTPLLLRAYVYLGLIESVLVLSGYFWVLFNEGWRWGMHVPLNSPLVLKASTMTFLGIVATQVGTVFATRTNRVSVFKIGIFSNPWVVWGIIFETLVTLALLYVPPLQRFFGMAPLGLKEWAFVAAFPFIIFLAEELRKLLVRRFNP